MTHRNRKLLDLAHDMPCMAKFPHNCTGWQGCEPMHSDVQMFGRGFSHKSNDWAFAAGCHVAHEMLSTFDREQKKTEWMLAFVGTQNYIWEHGKVRVA